MSGMHDGAPVDPLTALRAADHRPLVEVWRERLYGGFVSRLRRSGRVAAPAVVVAMLVVAIGWRMFVTTQPPIEDSIPLASSNSAQAAEPPTSLAPPSPLAPAASPGGVESENPQPVIVHVAGAVSRPGLISGEAGWRVDDAVRAAGGAVSQADLDRLNLAAEILDGQRIYVPFLGEDEPAVVNPTSGPSAQSSPGPVNLNTADAAALESLPGVGPATAAVIIAHRDTHGKFGSIDSLVAVRGIGPATLESLREHVTV